MTTNLALPLTGLVAPDPMDPKHIGDSWRTPPELFIPVREWIRMAWPVNDDPRILLDPCTGPGSFANAVEEVVLPRDGLAVDWVEFGAGGLTWVNPPYSDPEPWIARCVAHGRVPGCHAMALVNVRTSDGWWPSPWPPAVCFLDGRVKFVSPDGKRHMTSQDPSALMYFGKYAALFEHVFTPLGRVVRS